MKREGMEDALSSSSIEFYLTILSFAEFFFNFWSWSFRPDS